MKTIIKSIFAFGLITCLSACDGRRDFPDLVESGVTFSTTDILLVSGDTQRVEATFVPNINPSRNYDWTVDDPAVADVVVNEDQSASITATGSGETTLRITSMDADKLTADVRLKVIRAKPVDITSTATIAVNREYSGGADGREGSLKLVDGDIETKYLSGYRAPFYMTLQFTEKKVINFYRLTSGNDAPNRDPLDWEIQGSNDGETWVTLDTRTDEKFDSRKQTREFYFDNDTAYEYYRFDVLKNNGGSLFQMQEWALLEIPAN